MDRKPLVLLIDDDVDFVRINRAILEHNGYEVESAATSAEGVAKAVERKPDVIVLDLMIESTSAGATVAQMLREHDELKNVPILLATAVRRIKPWWGNVTPNTDWLPVNKVLDKPISPDELLAEIAAVLGR